MEIERMTDVEKRQRALMLLEIQAAAAEIIAMHKSLQEKCREVENLIKRVEKMQAEAAKNGETS